MTPISRRAALGGALALAAGPAFAQTLSDADRADVARVEGYINALATLRARFTQVSPLGRVAKGTIMLKRPNRLRVEYDPPVKLRIFATPQWLIVEDCKLKEPQYLPLSSSPAGILTKSDIRFSGDITVMDVKRENLWLTVRVFQTRARDKGTMALVFERQPLKLIGWTVTDPHHGPTQVTFENVQTGLPLADDQFGFIGKCD
jgi:outer membrane lipoprotein-sorting protein